jgi:cytidylate kinase
MRRARPVVAIDGPAGAGKTTVARGVARALGYVLVDTGALYRAVAFAAQQRGVAFDDPAAIEALAEALVRDGALVMQATAGEVPKIVLGGHELGAEIRTPALSMAASSVSAHAGVRQALLALQRRFGADGGVVLEGRDIGTVVFPDAEVKVFLTAAARQRAERRYVELQQRGSTVSFDDTLAEVLARDEQDRGRAIAPLQPAPDAVTVDSTDVPAERVVQQIVALVRAKERG